MKQTIIIMMFMLGIIATTAQAQNTKHFANYAGVSTSLSTPGDMTFTIEGGKWGNDVPLTVGASIDYVKNLHDGSMQSWWFGIKPYYTLYSQGKYACFVWFTPKIELTNLSNYLIENGVGLQKQMKDSPWYLWWMLGTQTGNGFSYVPSVSIGINYVK